MIYAAVKPIEEYDEILTSGRKAGLYSSYHTYPALLALVMISTTLPYDYEGNRPRLQRRTALLDPTSLIASLTHEIAGQPLFKILEDLNPLEISRLIKLDDRLHEMPMVKEIYFDEVNLLRSVVGARAAAWASVYRGKVRQEGKVVKAFFGGEKSQLEIPLVDLEVHKSLTERYANEFKQQSEE